MDGSAQHAEYAVKKKYEGKYKLSKILMIAGYVMFPIVIIITVASFSTALLVWFLPLTPMGLMLIIQLTYRYVQIEYEYSIDSGTITFSEIYGLRSRKQKFEIKLSDAIAIAPYRDEYKNQADTAENKYIACSSLLNPELYYILFDDEDSKRSLIFFDPTNKALKLMKFHNRATVETQVSI